MASMNGHHPPPALVEPDTARQPAGEYEDFAKRLSREAREAHKVWLDKMGPAERRKMAEMGLDGDLNDYEIESNRGDEDAAEWDEASITMQFEDKLPDRLRELFALTEEQARMIAAWHLLSLERNATSYRAFLLQRVIAGFMRPGNVKLRAYGLAFASDLAALNGLGTMTEAAALMGVSRASISKSANEWTDLLELPRSEHMKSQASRASYSAAQTGEKHWRNKKFKAPQQPNKKI